MTNLVDYQIEGAINAGTITIEPFDTKRIQPSSIDLTLSDSFVYRDFNCTKREITLEPLEFALGSTLEYVKLPDYITGIVYGVSSVGRKGLQIENAGVVDAGFFGQITLELFNAKDKPITLKAGQRICQMRFDVHKSCRKPYHGKYVGQMGATESRGNE